LHVMQPAFAGVDLVREKRSAREEQKAAVKEEKARTFEECAQAYIDECWNNWSEKHRNQWPSSLNRYAYPTIGQLKISEIRPSHAVGYAQISRRPSAPFPHGRGVVVVVSVEEYGRLDSTANATLVQANDTAAAQHKGKA
jgi:hypothetical protein